MKTTIKHADIINSGRNHTGMTSFSCLINGALLTFRTDRRGREARICARAHFNEIANSRKS